MSDFARGKPRSGGGGEAEEFETVLAESVSAGTFVSLLLSGPVDRERSPQRQTVRPVEVRSQLLHQWTLQVGVQERHENHPSAETPARAMRLFPEVYRNARVVTAEEEIQARVTKRGGIRMSRRGAPTAIAASSLAHNREPERLLREGTPVPFLAAIGVMTGDGKVRAPQQHKFRQINRYLEFVEDIVPHLPAEGTLRVVDFGCGKSGLTFAVHHLLHVVHGRDVFITGLDRNPSVIATCREIASRLQLEGLEFEPGDIASYQPSGEVHLAISLHACDTATDDALAQGVAWKTNVILAAPCCQHEFAPQLEAGALAPLLEHGILRQRLAADATDAMRAAWLELHGYRAQVIEFIELEHTPKNLLIRGVRQEAAPSAERLELLRSRYDQFKQLLGVRSFALERAGHFVAERSTQPGD